MFTIKPMSAGSRKYYWRTLQYYLRSCKKKKKSKDEATDDDSPDLGPDGTAPGFEDGEGYSIYLPGDLPGQWGGGAAPVLNLSGIIQEEHYHRIYHGFHPHTGEPLVQNAGKPSRRPGWECCLSAFKDFSILTFAVPAKWRKRFLKVFWKVVRDTLRMIEEQYAFSRVGKAKDGCRYVPVRILAALWQHCSSRLLNEALHVHLQIHNLGVDAQGKFRALDSEFIYQNQKTITIYFQSKLAAEIKKHFGLTVEADGATYRIKGMPRDLVREKSKRREAILTYMAETGEKDASKAAIITRPKKNDSITLAELMDKWRAENIAAGFDDAAVAHLLRNAREDLDDDEPIGEDSTETTPNIENTASMAHLDEGDHSIRDIPEESSTVILPPDTLQTPSGDPLSLEVSAERPQETLPKVVDCNGTVSNDVPSEVSYDSSSDNGTADVQAAEMCIAESSHLSSPIVGCVEADIADVPLESLGEPLSHIPSSDIPTDEPQEAKDYPKTPQSLPCDSVEGSNRLSDASQTLSDVEFPRSLPADEPPIHVVAPPTSDPALSLGQEPKSERPASVEAEPGRILESGSQKGPAAYTSWQPQVASGNVGRSSSHCRHRTWNNPPPPTAFGPVTYPPGVGSVFQRPALNRRSVIPKRRHVGRPNSVTRKLIRQAIMKATRRRNHFSKRELHYHTLYQLPRYGIDPRPVLKEVDHFLRHSSQIVPLGNDNGCDPRYTTKVILENERRLLAAFERMAKRPGRRVSKRKLRKALKKFRTLNNDQKEFLIYLAQFPRSFRLGLGNAGVGKSYVLKALFYAFKRQGLRLHVLAPAGKTADDLTNDTGVECQTLTKFLGDFLLPWSVQLRHHLRQLWRAARHRKTWPFRQPQPPKLTARDVVVVDEAGMMGTRLLRILAELVERAGATLILLGDPNQLPSVEGTPPLPTLAAKYGAIYLKKIIRQKKAWARKAARLFAEGHVGQALRLFADHKKITVRDNLEELLLQACWEWTEQGLLTPEQTLIVTNENAVAHQINLLCQEHRLKAGCIRSSPSIRITDEQPEDIYDSHVYCGDRVVFTQNTQTFPKGYGVKNGSRGTVVEIHSFTGRIVVLLDNKKLVRIPVRKYPHIRLGYAVTTYKSQSSSVPYVYAVVVGTNFPAAYVQSTRAIERTLFYTTSNFLNADMENIAASRLAQQMSRRPDLRLASELLANAPLSLRPQKLHLRRPHRPPHRHCNLSHFKKADSRPRKEPVMISTLSHFWLVTKPNPLSQIEDICVPCDFTTYLAKVRKGLRPKHIGGIYADHKAALAYATKLLESPREPDSIVPSFVLMPDPIQCWGIPSSFWLVLIPRFNSQLSNICIESDFGELAIQALSGLRPKEVFGVYADREAAIAAASKLLEAICPPAIADIPTTQDCSTSKSLNSSSRFWLVTKPTPSSIMQDICFECDIDKYALQIMGSLHPSEIVGIYAEKANAIATASRLLGLMRHSDTANNAPRLQGQLPMEVVGMPQSFWLVAMPTQTSQIDDICSETNFTRLADQVTNGLRPREIVGVYADKNVAFSTASLLIETIRQLNLTDAPTTPIGFGPASNLDQSEADAAATPHKFRKAMPEESPLNQGFGDKPWTRRFYNADDPNADSRLVPFESRPLISRVDTCTMSAYSPFTELPAVNHTSPIRSSSPPNLNTVAQNDSTLPSSNDQGVQSSPPTSDPNVEISLVLVPQPINDLIAELAVDLLQQTNDFQLRCKLLMDREKMRQEKERERQEKERLENELIEKQRLEKQQLEQERIEQKQIEKDRLEKERRIFEAREMQLEEKRIKQESIHQDQEAKRLLQEEQRRRMEVERKAKEAEKERKALEHKQMEEEYRRSEEERRKAAAEEKIRRQEEKDRMRKETNEKRMEAKRIKQEAKQKAKEVKRIIWEEKKQRKKAERKMLEAEQVRKAIERKNMEDENRQREQERIIVAAEEKERKRKEAEEESKEKQRLKREAKQRKAEERRKWREAHPGWWERFRRMREEEKQRRIDAINERDENDRRRQMEHIDREKRQELYRMEEQSRLLLLKEQMGPVAFKQMMDEKELQALQEYEKLRAYYRQRDEEREKEEKAKQKAQESNGSGYDWGTPYSSTRHENEPVKSTPIPQFCNTSQPSNSSSNSSSSNQDYLTYGAAQTQCTQQNNNAIKRT
jgi:conjugative relaxase-like TrwC/TraI family protein